MRLKFDWEKGLVTALLDEESDLSKLAAGQTISSDRGLNGMTLRRVYVEASHYLPMAKAEMTFAQGVTYPDIYVSFPRYCTGDKEKVRDALLGEEIPIENNGDKPREKYIRFLMDGKSLSH